MAKRIDLDESTYSHFTEQALRAIRGWPTTPWRSGFD